jgi:eukaryotic-like serine/threonine-protein kinase
MTPLFTLPMLPEGSLVGNRYQVGKPIGRGSHGVVVSATDVKNKHEKVALKLLLPQHLRDVTLRKRFILEAKIASQLTNEHVLTVTDFGLIDANCMFMAMALLPGANLAQTLKKTGALAPEMVVRIILQTCEGLAQAHANQLIHRDLKPSNLFLTTHADGSDLVKIFDFGISKFIEGSTGKIETLTSVDRAVGTPQYMSPEQVCQDPPVNLQTDIWALGTIMYELLTGRPAFRAGSASELFSTIISKDPQPLEELRQDVPPSLIAIIQGCLKKDIAKRISNLEELSRRLLDWNGKPPSAEFREYHQQIAAILKHPPPLSRSLFPLFEHVEAEIRKIHGSGTAFKIPPTSAASSSRKRNPLPDVKSPSDSRSKRGKANKAPPQEESLTGGRSVTERKMSQLTLVFFSFAMTILFGTILLWWFR